MAPLYPLHDIEIAASTVPPSWPPTTAATTDAAGVGDADSAQPRPYAGVPAREEKRGGEALEMDKLDFDSVTLTNEEPSAYMPYPPPSVGKRRPQPAHGRRRGPKALPVPLLQEQFSMVTKERRPGAALIKFAGEIARTHPAAKSASERLSWQLQLSSSIPASPSPSPWPSSQPLPRPSPRPGATTWPPGSIGPSAPAPAQATPLASSADGGGGGGGGAAAVPVPAVGVVPVVAPTSPSGSALSPPANVNAEAGADTAVSSVLPSPTPSWMASRGQGGSTYHELRGTTISPAFRSFASSMEDSLSSACSSRHAQWRLPGQHLRPATTVPDYHKTTARSTHRNWGCPAASYRWPMLGSLESGRSSAPPGGNYFEGASRSTGSAFDDSLVLEKVEKIIEEEEEEGPRSNVDKQRPKSSMGYEQEYAHGPGGLARWKHELRRPGTSMETSRQNEESPPSSCSPGNSPSPALRPFGRSGPVPRPAPRSPSPKHGVRGRNTSPVPPGPTRCVMPVPGEGELLTGFHKVTEHLRISQLRKAKFPRVRAYPGLPPEFLEGSDVNLGDLPSERDRFRAMLKLQFSQDFSGSRTRTGRFYSSGGESDEGSSEGYPETDDAGNEVVQPFANSEGLDAVEEEESKTTKLPWSEEQLQAVYRNFVAGEDMEVHVDELIIILRYLGLRPVEEDIQEIVESLTSYTTLDWIEFLQFMRQYREHDVAVMRRQFMLADTDGSGVLDVDELHGMFVKFGYSPTKPVTMEALAAVDLDGSGTVSFDEFEQLREYLRSTSGFTADEADELSQLYTQITSGENGKLRFKDIQRINAYVGYHTTLDEIELAAAQVGKESVDDINFEELLKIIRGVRDIERERLQRLVLERKIFAPLTDSKERSKPTSKEISNAQADPSRSRSQEYSEGGDELVPGSPSQNHGSGLVIALSTNPNSRPSTPPSTPLGANPGLPPLFDSDDLVTRLGPIEEQDLQDLPASLPSPSSPPSPTSPSLLNTPSASRPPSAPTQMSLTPISPFSMSRSNSNSGLSRRKGSGTSVSERRSLHSLRSGRASTCFSEEDELDGLTLKIEHLGELLRHLGYYTTEELRQEILDDELDGRDEEDELNMDELDSFLLAFRRREGFTMAEMEHLKEIFALEQKGSGSTEHIDAFELARVLRWFGIGRTPQQTHCLIEDVDFTGQHCLNVWAFAKLMRSLLQAEAQKRLAVFNRFVELTNSEGGVSLSSSAFHSELDGELMLARHLEEAIHAVTGFVPDKGMLMLAGLGEPGWQDNDGISWTDFEAFFKRYRDLHVEWMAHKSGFVPGEVAVLQELFNQYDANGDGHLDSLEMRHMVAEMVPEATASNEGKAQVIEWLPSAFSEERFEFDHFLQFMRKCYDLRDEKDIKMEGEVIQECCFSYTDVESLRSIFSGSLSYAGELEFESLVDIFQRLVELRPYEKRNLEATVRQLHPQGRAVLRFPQFLLVVHKVTSQNLLRVNAAVERILLSKREAEDTQDSQTFFQRRMSRRVSSATGGEVSRRNSVTPIRSEL